MTHRNPNPVTLTDELAPWIRAELMGGSRPISESFQFNSDRLQHVAEELLCLTEDERLERLRHMAQWERVQLMAEIRMRTATEPA